MMPVPTATATTAATATATTATATAAEGNDTALRVYLLEGPDGKRSGRAPTRGSAGAAGYDLYSARDVLVPARGKALVKLDIAIKMPAGCYGAIWPRSSLAWKKFVDVGAGVIDEDYRGNVGVVLFNHAAEDLMVRRGDRVAQLVLERYVVASAVEVHDGPPPNDTARGAGGFGSTGA